MFTLNMTAAPLHSMAISHLLLQSGLHWKMPFAQLVMLERNAYQEQFTVTKEITADESRELMLFKGKHTMMGLPIKTYHDADNESYIELCHDDVVIARIENLAVPLES